METLKTTAVFVLAGLMAIAIIGGTLLLNALIWGPNPPGCIFRLFGECVIITMTA